MRKTHKEDRRTMYLSVNVAIYFQNIHQ